MESYSFTVLRYLHDTVAGEFGNVGVVLYSPKSKFIGGKFRKTAGRLTKMFPDMDRADFQAAMRRLNTYFKNDGESIKALTMFDGDAQASELASRILPRDDSSYQWSKNMGGAAKDLRAELDELYDRFIARYDQAIERKRITDDDVWKNFKKELEQRQVLEHFQPKTIKASHGELKVEHAYKNGIWHCLEPLSFDLSDSDNIHAKAYRWTGQMLALDDAKDQFKMYFLVGRPQDSGLSDAFDNAMYLLRRSHPNSAIYLDTEVDQLSDVITDAVKLNQQSG